MPLPRNAKARKEIPIYSGFISYFHLAVAAVASHSFVSNEQHNPGEPLHWSRNKSMDQMDALARHLSELPEAVTVAEEIELLKAISWRAMAQLQLKCEHQAKMQSAVSSSVAVQQAEDSAFDRSELKRVFMDGDKDHEE